MTLSDLIQPSAKGGLSGRAANGARLQAVLAGIVLALGVVGLWLLNHPYQGVIHDARLYIGQVLAAADPEGVGRDIMFAKDGQFGFTVFPALLKGAVAAFGISQGAKLVSLVSLVAWLGALAYLASTMAKGRVRWVSVLFVVVLPTSYGGFHIFHYAEPMATPRAFAEAGVLFAFALLCQGRQFWALLPLAASALFHPIMALPGFGVWAWLALFDPEERIVPLAVGLACAGAAVVLLLLAAAFHVPLADRLFVGIDPAFGEILQARTPFLFPANWPVETWSHFFVQVATLAVATRVVEGRVRSLLIATIVIGIGGVAAAYVLGGVFGSLLAVQVQLWRSAWIVAVLSAAALAMSSVQLWRQGGSARLALGCLFIAWLGAETPVIGFPAAMLALIFTFWPRMQRLRIQPKLMLAFWGFVGVYALLTFAIRLYSLASFAAAGPDGSRNLVFLLSMFGVWAVPVCVLALVYALARPPERLLLPLGASAILVAVLGVAFWDVRDARTLDADKGTPDPALQALLSSRTGAVLWPDGRFDTWSLAGRPNWISTMQGSGAVFSRPLAMLWDERARLLTDLGLTDQRLRAPFSAKGQTSSEEPHLANLSDASLEQLCARPDAPAWLIAPAKVMKDSQLSASQWSPSYWRAPSPAPSFGWDGKTVTWTATQDYVVLPCGS